MNKKGQVLVLFIICIPIMITLFSYLIEVSYIAYNKHKIYSVTKTIIAKNYSNPNESVSYNTLVDLDVSNGTDFYQARQEKIEKLLNDSSRKLTEEQKSYWLDMNSKVEEPFQYGYYKSLATIISCFELLMFSLLAVCIVIAPVFGLNPLFVAALGYCSVFGAATNTFLAPIAIGMEVFGYQYFPFFFIVCAISYIANQNESIYALQRQVRE